MSKTPAAAMRPFAARLAPNAITSVVVRIIGALVIMQMLVLVIVHGEAWGAGQGAAPGVVSAFHLDLEHNIPTLIAVLMLLTTSALLCVAAHVETGGWRRKAPWGVLAFGFLFLALDEFLQIHESAAHLLMGGVFFTGAFYYLWVIPYGLAALAIAALLAPWLLRLDAPTRNRLLLAGALYVGGAVGMEIIGGALFAVGDDPSTYRRTLLIDLVSSLEEIMELAGVALMADAVYRRLCGAGIEIASRPATDARARRG